MKNVGLTADDKFSKRYSADCISLLHRTMRTHISLNVRQTIHFEIRFFCSSEAYRKWWEYKKYEEKNDKREKTITNRKTREETIVNFSILFFIMHIEF